MYMYVVFFFSVFFLFFSSVVEFQCSNVLICSYLQKEKLSFFFLLVQSSLVKKKKKPMDYYIKRWTIQNNNNKPLGCLSLKKESQLKYILNKHLLFFQKKRSNSFLKR